MGVGTATLDCHFLAAVASDAQYLINTADASVPIDTLIPSLSPYLSTPGDGNAVTLYVYAKPINGSIQCTGANFITEELD